MKRNQTVLFFLFIVVPFFAQQHAVIPQPVDITLLQSFFQRPYYLPVNWKADSIAG